jgi:NhaP-type Na+/H+ or K+/H+ antiporter
VVGFLLLFGGALVSGLLHALTWRGALVSVLVVFVVRPLSGFLALLGSGLSPEERTAISFFGIRGFGSVYYLAYGLTAATFAGAGELWAIVALTMVTSIAVHGISATPAMALVDRAYRRQRRAGGDGRSHQDGQT